MPTSKAAIGELRDRARRARAMADDESIAWLRGLKNLPPFERAIGLWAWSEALTASADSRAALAELARWLSEGDPDDVRAAALVIAWRADGALASLAQLWPDACRPTTRPRRGSGPRSRSMASPRRRCRSRRLSPPSSMPSRRGARSCGR